MGRRGWATAMAMAVMVRVRAGMARAMANVTMITANAAVARGGPDNGDG
jgi:hypothetical protein